MREYNLVTLNEAPQQVFLTDLPRDGELICLPDPTRVFLVLYVLHRPESPADIYVQERSDLVEAHEAE